MSNQSPSESFERWVDFVFNPPASTSSQTSEEWAVRIDPKTLILYSTQLFDNPSFLMSRYTADQLEEGFWFLLGPENRLADLLWDQSIDLLAREQCVLAMPIVFERLFAKDPLDQACYMWWDLLRNFEADHDERIQEAMLEALRRILKIDSGACQMSALHGLGHLRHPDKLGVISDFLHSNPGIDEKLRSYALSALKGEVL